MNKLILKWHEISERPLKINAQISQKYTIKKVLGKGSYGFTYLVDDKQGTSYVLKQLRKYKMLDDHGRASFQREADILKTLRHSAYPAFYEQFEENGRSFILMEYKQGFTFEQLIFNENHIYDEKASFYHLERILEIVKPIHNLGIVHRDLRIPNILMNGNEYYIIDFGLARKISDKKSNEEVNEILAKQLFREIAFKSDFYALGHFVLFLLYSGYEPETKKSRSWEDELELSVTSKKILRKMLQLDEPYPDIEQLLMDVKLFNGGI